MGKTKTKVMDDSVQVEPEKKPKKLGRQDELVEKLKAELAGVGEEPKKEKETKHQPKHVEPKQESPLDSREKAEPEKKALKVGKAKPRSKKYQEVTKDLDRTKTYPVNEAVELTKKLSYTKFTGTLEAHINTIQTGLRGLVSLPFASGKKLKILAFGKDAKTCGADAAGSDETIDQISKGKVDFDLVVTTSEWMPKLAKVARILGPKGLMPNPKNGTITDNLKGTITGFQSGKTEYKTEQKAAVIHLGLGKLNQPTEELSANIKILTQTLGKSRVKKITLSPTMGPSVKLDLTSL